MFSKLTLFSLIVAVVGYANAQSFTGQATFYSPSVGIGSCGMANTDAELVAALNAPQYDPIKPCNRKIRVHYQDKSVDVTIVDRCGGCASGDVDLSPAAFSLIADQSLGRIPITWEYI